MSRGGGNKRRQAELRQALARSGCAGFEAPRRGGGLFDFFGGQDREEYQTPDGEALRRDDEFSYVAAWEFQGVGEAPVMHKEPLAFEEVHPSQRSYK